MALQLDTGRLAVFDFDMHQEGPLDQLLSPGNEQSF